MFDSMLESGLINDEDSKVMLCTKWGFYLKELYRSNYVQPKTDCSASSMDIEDIDCGFTCVDENYAMMGVQMKKTINGAYVPGDLGKDEWDQWRDFVCDGDGFRVFVGDQLESASPSDPAFWPIHPSQERLLHAKLLSGGFDDFKWPTDSKSDYVCDKAECYEDGDKGYHDECCYGHYEDDQLLDFINADKGAGYGPTNKAILEDSDPTSSDYSMTYIYDDFTWSHCEGEDFEGLFESLYKAASDRRTR